MRASSFDSHKSWYLLFLCWTLLIVSFAWHENTKTRQSYIEIASAEARASYNKDLLYRRWAASHGGLYVPITENSPANPYLKNIPERDIQTPSGKSLTLINPAYMTRQVHEMAAEQYGVKGHITSLKVIRPENAPDAWEKEALNSFEKGETEYKGLTEIGGTAYLREMYPMVVEEICLKCHAEQGYTVGDIRGGISVSVPLEPYLQLIEGTVLENNVIHLLIWIIGIIFLVATKNAINRRTDTVRRSEEKFRRLVEKTKAVPWELDIATQKFTYVGPAIEEMFGYPSSYWADMDSWIRMLHAEDRDASVEYCLSATKKGEDHDFIYRAVRADGSMVWIHDIVSVQVGLNGPEKLFGFFVDVTKDKENDQRMNLLFEQASDPIFVSDTHGQLLHANNKACLSTGYTKNELLQLNVRDLDAKATAIEDLQGFFDSIEYGESTLLTTAHQRKNGSQLPVEVTVSKIQTPFGDQVIGVARDVSARVHDENIRDALLRLSEFAAQHSIEALLQKFLDEAEALTQSKIGFYHFVDDDQVTVSLQAWSKNTLASFCSVELKEQHYPLANAGVWADGVHEKKPVIHNDYSALTHKKGLPEGHAPVTRQLLVPVLRYNKVVAVLAVGNKDADYSEDDVQTIQRLADMAWETVSRRQAEIELEQNVKRFEDIAFSIGDWIWEVDYDGIYTFSSEKSVDVIGYIAEEILGKSCFDFMTDEQAKDAREFVKGTFAQGTPFRNYENWIVHKNGHEVLLSTSGVPIKDATGKVLGYRGVDTDITDRYKHQAQAIRTSQLASLGELSAGVAHEINNPISGVINYADILRDRIVDEAHKDLLGRIIKEGERIAEIVKKMLSFSRDDKNVFKRHSVYDLVDVPVTLISSQLKKEDIVIEQHLEDGLPLLNCNANQIEQVFINLLSNARHALNEKFGNGDGKKNISISVKQIEKYDKKWVEFSFEDNGTGIAKRNLARIFKPFYTTKGVGVGTGLGLSISEDIIHSHEGMIRFESLFGEYTRAIVELPITPQSN